MKKNKEITKAFADLFLRNSVFGIVFAVLFLFPFEGQALAPGSCSGYTATVYDPNTTGADNGHDMWTNPEVNPVGTFPYVEFENTGQHQSIDVFWAISTHVTNGTLDDEGYTGTPLGAGDWDWAVKFRRTITADEAGPYSIVLNEADDHVWIYVNGVLLYSLQDAWVSLGGGSITISASHTFNAGDVVDILVAEETSHTNELNLAITPLFASPCLLDHSDTPEDGETAPDGVGTTSYGVALHTVDADLSLGDLNDDEPGDITSADASGDGAEDDGVFIPNLFQDSDTIFQAEVKQLAAGDGYLQAWVDWNGDGDFADSGEQVATDLQYNAGASGDILFPVSIPANAITSAPTFARFRWSTTAGLDSTSHASDGEVEDYQVTIYPVPPAAPTGSHECSAYTGAWTDAGSGTTWTSTSSSGVGVTLGMSVPAGGTFTGSATAHTMGTINAWSDTAVQGADSLRFTFEWDDTDENAFEDPADDGVTGELTITYDQPVTNPVIHLDRLGGSSGKNSINYPNSAILELTTAGASLVRLAGPPHFITEPNRIYRYGGGTTLSIGGEASLDPEGGTAAGSVMVPGTHTTLTFNFTGAFYEGAGADGIEIALCAPVTDYGDAPTSGTAPDGVSTNSYGEVNHTIETSIHMGTSVDADSGHQASAAADGDDSDATDDEDGVTFPTLTQGATSTIDVDVTQAAANDGYLQAWIDWNGDGDFADSGEQVATDRQYSAGTTGTIAVHVTAPATAITSAPTFARFRWSSDQGLNATDTATDGEVEDYQISISSPASCSLDMLTPTVAVAEHTFTASGSAYASRMIDNSGMTGTGEAATHWVASLSASWMGLHPNTTAWLDFTPPAGANISGVYLWNPETFNYAHGDGPVKDFTATITYNGGQTATTSSFTTVQPTGQGHPNFVQFFDFGQTYANVTNVRLNITEGWFDTTDADGPWLGTDDVTVTPTYNMTLSEVRLCGNLLNLDYGDAPADGSTAPDGTASATSYGTPNHTIVSGIHMGSTAPDGDSSHQASATANGDDSDGTDDEDGVTFPTLTQGAAASIDVAVNQAAADDGYLQAWIDWNGDGDFADTGEQIATDLQYSAGTSGTISVSVTPPATAITSADTFARFRWSTTSGLDSTTAASDGEVEDYQLSIEESIDSLAIAQCPSGTTPVQVNIISNPSFENYSSCPNLSTALTIPFADDWHDTLTDGGQLLVNDPPSCISPRPGTAWPVSTNMASGADGVAWLGMHSLSATTGEGATNTLASPLLPGNTYVGHFATALAIYSPWFTGDGKIQFIGVPNNTTTTGENLHLTDPITSVASWDRSLFTFQPTQQWDYLRVEARSSGVDNAFIYYDDFVMYECRLPRDYSDAPADNSTAPDGTASATSYGEASHAIVAGIHMGSTAPDADSGHQASAVAGDASTGDDGDGTDDEDGVTFPTLTQGAAASIDVAVNQAAADDGYLQAWIDWNGDGDFADTGEQIATDLQYSAGTSGTISVSVTPPATAITSADTFARFRWSTIAGLGATGSATNGEVEDYQVGVEPGGYPVSGRVYIDTNVDGVNDSGEASISDLPVVLTGTDDNSNTVCMSVRTDADGNYLFPLVLPGTYQLYEASRESVPTPQSCDVANARDPQGYVSTTDNVLASFTVSNAGVTGKDFGDVKMPTFSPDHSGSILPGTNTYYAHRFSPRSSGAVSFGAADSTPVTSGWTSALYQDSDCNGELDGTEGASPLSGSLTTTAGTDICLINKVYAPANVQTGESWSNVITANFDTGNGTAGTTALSVTDLTKAAANDPGAGSSKLELRKTVENLTQTTAETGIRNEAKPGDVLKYRVYYSNSGDDPITDLEVKDTVPEFTTLEVGSMSCETTPASLTCTPDAVNDPDLEWGFTGSLEAGESGTVSYEVKID